VLISSAIL